MSKTMVVRCADTGFDCSAIIRSDNEKDLFNKITEHARKVHNLTEITDDIVAKVKSAIRFE